MTARRDPLSSLVFALVLFLAALVGMVVGLAVGAWTTGERSTAPEPSPATTSPGEIRYTPCAPGGVHAWEFPGGGGAVMPAGSDCPDAAAAGSPTGEEKP